MSQQEYLAEMYDPFHTHTGDLALRYAFPGYDPTAVNLNDPIYKPYINYSPTSVNLNDPIYRPYMYYSPTSVNLNDPLYKYSGMEQFPDQAQTQQAVTPSANNANTDTNDSEDMGQPDSQEQPQPQLRSKPESNTTDDDDDENTPQSQSQMQSSDELPSVDQLIPSADQLVPSADQLTDERYQAASESGGNSGSHSRALQMLAGVATGIAINNAVGHRSSSVYGTSSTGGGNCNQASQYAMSHQVPMPTYNPNNPSAACSSVQQEMAVQRKTISLYNACGDTATANSIQQNDLSSLETFYSQNCSR